VVNHALLEDGILPNSWQLAIALAIGVGPGPMGSAQPLNAPYWAFKTADGRIMIGGSHQNNRLNAEGS
jgi:crotonobetainyl-CoA:carnitine CoA-transferase CaiB-like acyl-CoA transferase